jgi:hypothetical protein
MTEELNAIAAIPGITGLCLHRGEELLHCDFPPALGRATAADLCHAVAGALSAYAEAGRPVTQSYFEYPEGGVLTICSGRTSSPEFQLTFLVNDRAAIAQVMAPARAFLKRQTRIG